MTPILHSVLGIAIHHGSCLNDLETRTVMILEARLLGACFFVAGTTTFNLLIKVIETLENAGHISLP